MIVEEFIDRFNGAPIELQEFAHAALEVTTDPVLVAKASYYLTAMDDFLNYLNSIGVELG